MRRFPTAILAMVLAAVMAATAAAEVTLPVTGVSGAFDQPSVAMNGADAHVAYIGAATTTGSFRVYYAAVNSGADFTNLLLARDSILVTPPTEVVDAGGDVYADARHPRIALRSSTEVVIFFQAKPSGPADTAYLLYRALLTLDNNVVVSQSVLQVDGVSPGNIEDVSFGLVAADNTARLAYANRTTTSPTAPFQVFYARVGLDNATVVGPPLPLSSGNGDTFTGSDGYRPIPSLRLDGLNRSHVAWAAGDNSLNPGGIYYALVKEVSGQDNVVIGATEILGRTKRWAHPNVLVSSTSDIFVFAADESFPGVAGIVGWAELNPDADNQDGSPVVIATNRSFLVQGPNLLSPSFDLLRPEVFLDTVGGRFLLTGYGGFGTSATYYAIKTSTAYPFATFQTLPASVGFNEYPTDLTGDYTKAAFGFPGGKVIIFWSGKVPGSNDRNLNMTTVPTVAAFIESKESGCTFVRHSGRDGAAGTGGAVLLLLPVAALAVLRIRRRFRTR